MSPEQNDGFAGLVFVLVSVVRPHVLTAVESCIIPVPAPCSVAVVLLTCILPQL